MMLSLACGPPSIVMLGDCGGDRCCGLSNVGMVEIVGFRQVMWIVMLESAKNRVLGVDTLGQQLPPCVQYGRACLVIRDAMGNVPCSDEWEIGIVTGLGSHGAIGVVVPLLA
jgi:hypothetical protein